MGLPNMGDTKIIKGGEDEEGKGEKGAEES